MKFKEQEKERIELNYPKIKNFYEWINDQHKQNLNNWFRNSKVVDQQGNPLVVYHGTSDVIKSFDPQASAGLGSFARKGIFFTNDPESANSYASQRQPLEFKKIIADFNKAKEEHDDYVYELSVKAKSHAPKSYSGETIPRIMTSWLNDLNTQGKITNQELENYYKLEDKLLKAEDKYQQASRDRWDKATPNLIPVYLRIEKPLIVGGDMPIPWDAVVPNNLQSFDHSKYDGIIFKNIIDNGDDNLAPSTVYVVFKPEQIKSATGNKGTYSDSPNMID